MESRKRSETIVHSGTVQALYGFVLTSQGEDSSRAFLTPHSYVKDCALSLLPESGTMGSKRGGARVTGSSTSSAIWAIPWISNYYFIICQRLNDTAV